MYAFVCHIVNLIPLFLQENQVLKAEAQQAKEAAIETADSKQAQRAQHVEGSGAELIRAHRLIDNQVHHLFCLHSFVLCCRQAV